MALTEAAGAALLGSAAIGGIGSVLNGNNTYSNSSSNYSNYGVSGGWANNWSEGIGENWGESITYGREASAQDLYNAAQANALQADFWQNQADYNAEQAREARAWEEYMSNTSYQRAVADLKKAGLNPALAAMNMGASTPTAVSASSGLATSHKANAYAQSESRSYGYNKNASSGASANSSYEVGSGSSLSDFSSETQLKSILNSAVDLFSNATNNGKNTKKQGGTTHKSSSGGTHGGGGASISKRTGHGGAF